MVKNGEFCGEAYVTSAFIKTAIIAHQSLTLIPRGLDWRVADRLRADLPDSHCPHHLNRWMRKPSTRHDSR